MKTANPTILFRYFTLFFVVFFLSACAAKKPKPDDISQVQKQIKLDQEKVQPAQPSQHSVELQNIEEEELKEYVKKSGVVFAKTDFSGLLNNRFVKLLFIGHKPENKFQIYVGEPEDKTQMPQSAKSVTAGYFFIELPEDEYTISSVSIPVGSTLAQEPMNVKFKVEADMISYIGTLKVVGTKEKIRLGGVPVIKPGFEYTVEIVDEWQEALETFKERYPNIPQEIKLHLMEAMQTTQESSKEQTQ